MDFSTGMMHRRLKMKPTPPGPSLVFPSKISRQFSSPFFKTYFRDPIKTLSRIAEKYGEISHFKVGRQHVFLINNPSYIENILVHDHSNFTKGPSHQTQESVLGEGLVTSEGEYHHDQRKIIQPIFIPRKVASYGSFTIDHVSRMCQSWCDGSVLDIHEEMMKVTLGIICKSLLNYDIESEEVQRISKALAITRGYFRRLQHPIFQILDHFTPKREAFGSNDVLDSIIYRAISERRNRKSSQYYGKGEEEQPDDFLSRLMRMQNPQFKNKLCHMSDKQVRDQIVTFLLAGHETIADALSWTFYLVSRNPSVEQKLQEEVDSLMINKSVPSVDDISRLEYSEKIFRESMRIYPPVWTIGRYVSGSNYSLGEYVIPSGSIVLMSQYIIHHDPRYYDKPEIFDPDRWTEEFSMRLPRFSYFPFGGGIRGCIGESFAWQTGILLIATVSRYWTMRLIPNQHIKPYPGITLNPNHGIKMKLNLRARLM